MKYYPQSSKKLFSAAISAALVTSSVVAVAPASAAAAETQSFTDVKQSDYFYEAVHNLTAREIIKGYADGTYRPYASVTRAQAAKILALTLGLDTTNVKNPGFTDVKTSDWYYGSVAALVERGILQGYGDTFKPSETLTRAQMAKIITLGFGFGEENLTNNPFKDVKTDDWFAAYLPNLISNGITTGRTPDTFDPYANVTRGQMAAFVFRSEAAVNPNVVESEIVNITNTSIQLTDGTYSLTDELKKWLNPSNVTALKGAIIKLSVKEANVEAVESVEITANGTASTDKSNPYKNHVVLNGNGAIFAGSLKVNGDFVSVKNMTIKEDLEIGKEVQSSFYSEEITVEGETNISETEKSSLNKQVNNFYKSLSYIVPADSFKAAADSSVNVVLVDSKFNTVQVEKSGITIEAKGTTSVKSIIVSSNTVLKVDKGITLPKVTIKKGAKELNINASVGELLIASTDDVTVKGKANIKKVIIESGKEINLKIDGKIDNLEVKSKDSKVEADKNTDIKNIEVPKGSKVNDIVDKKKNSSSSGSRGGSSSGGGSSSDNTAPQVTVDSQTVEIGDAITTAQSSEKGVLYLVLADANIKSKAEAEEAVTQGKAKKAIVSLADTDVTISTSGLAPGVYKVIAVDEAGNLSNKSTSTITLNEKVVEPTPEPPQAGDAKFNKLTVSNDVVTNGDDETIVIRVQTENIKNTDTSVELWLNDEAVTSLVDDGDLNNGDDISKDGVYSAVYDPSSLPIGENNFKVIAKDAGEIIAESEFTLTVIEPYSDEEVTEISTLSTEAIEKAAEIIAQGKSVEETKETLVQELKNNNESVIEAEPSESNGVWYASTSGTLGGVIIPEENTEQQQLLMKKEAYSAQFAASSSNQQEYIGNNQVLVISTGEEKPELADIKQTLDSKFNVKTVSGSVEDLKTVAKYGMVIFNTDGTSMFGKNLKQKQELSSLDADFAEAKEKIVLLTSEKVTDEKTKKYQKDLKTGRLVIVNDFYAITPSFAKKYWKDMSDTLFVNASAYSAVNDSLSKVLLKNGVKTYVGVQSSNVSLYSVKTFIEKLVEGSTTGEAFSGLSNTLSLVGSSNVSLFLKGLQNGNFETGDTSGWFGHGDVRVISKLGEDSTNLKALTPVEGNNMAIISTGLGSLDDDSNSFIERTFEIPEGMTALKFDYNVVSEEPMEYVGTQFNDQFEATLSTGKDKVSVLANESVNTSDWIQKVNIDLPGGDHTTYSTGWKRVVFDVSELQGQTVTLKFHTWDEGDSIYDTGVLLDDVRFTDSVVESLEIDGPDKLSVGLHQLTAVLKDQYGDNWTSQKEVQWKLVSLVEGVELSGNGELTVLDTVTAGTKIKVKATFGNLHADKDITILEKSSFGHHQIDVLNELNNAKVVVSSLVKGEKIKVYQSENSKEPVLEVVSEGESVEFEWPFDHEIYITSTQPGKVESDKVDVYTYQQDDVQFTNSVVEIPGLNEEFTFSVKAYSLAEHIDPENSKLRYKVEVFTYGEEENEVAASGLQFYYKEQGQSDYSSSFTTNEDGVAYFGPEDGLTASAITALKSKEGIETGFKTTFDQLGNYELRISLVDVSGEEDIYLGETYFGFNINEAPQLKKAAVNVQKASGEMEVISVEPDDGKTGSIDLSAYEDLDYFTGFTISADDNDIARLEITHEVIAGSIEIPFNNGVAEFTPSALGIEDTGKEGISLGKLRSLFAEEKSVVIAGKLFDYTGNETDVELTIKLSE